MNNHFKIYALDIPSNQFDYHKVLTSLKEEAFDLFEEIDLPAFKFSLTVNCSFKRELEDCEECIENNWFRSQCNVKINNEDIELLINESLKQIELQIQNFIKLGSGKWMKYESYF